MSLNGLTCFETAVYDVYPAPLAGILDLGVFGPPFASAVRATARTRRQHTVNQSSKMGIIKLI